MKTTFDQDERHTMNEAKCILSQWYHKKQTMLEGRASWRPRGLTWWNIVATPCSSTLNGYEAVPNTTHLLGRNQVTVLSSRGNKLTGQCNRVKHTFRWKSDKVWGFICNESSYSFSVAPYSFSIALIEFNPGYYIHLRAYTRFNLDCQRI